MKRASQQADGIGEAGLGDAVGAEHPVGDLAGPTFSKPFSSTSLGGGLDQAVGGEAAAWPGDRLVYWTDRVQPGS